MKNVAVLGSTGSIGTSALRVLARHADRFKVVALTAHNNANLLSKQEAELKPGYVGIVNKHGTDCLIEAASLDNVDVVLNAIVGAAGLDATLAALKAGKRVALANKETLVMGGELVTRTCAEGGGEIVPVDSEHSAILQCINSRPKTEIKRVIITASGGPFRGYTNEQLQQVTVNDALRHPTWTMGRKITVDSATLANKALEVIEAHFLFGLSYDQIEVVVHPQSLVHSFVEFVDGSVVAQIGCPNMELPILYALTHPERITDNDIPKFDPIHHSLMTFEPVDETRFPTLRLGIEAGKQGGTAPAIFNAANEQAVALFLDGHIKFTDIPKAIESALAKLNSVEADGAFGLSAERNEREPTESPKPHQPGRNDLIAADRQARNHVKETYKC